MSCGHTQPHKLCQQEFQSFFPSREGLTYTCAPTFASLAAACSSIGHCPELTLHILQYCSGWTTSPSPCAKTIFFGRHGTNQLIFLHHKRHPVACKRLLKQPGEVVHERCLCLWAVTLIGVPLPVACKRLLKQSGEGISQSKEKCLSENLCKILRLYTILEYN